MRRDEYDLNESRRDFITRMELEGNRIVLPADNELQIDIDSEEDYLRFLQACAVLERNEVEHKIIRITESRSGYPKRHIIIEWPTLLDPWKRIALQAALGSDHIRELLSSIRLMRGDEHPTLLVEKNNGT